MKAPPQDDGVEVSIMSYARYFTNMWILGIRMIFKALVGSFFSRFQGVGNQAVPYRDSQEAAYVLRGPVAKGDVD
jgi:hypothetical protein